MGGVRFLYRDFGDQWQIETQRVALAHHSKRHVCVENHVCCPVISRLQERRQLAAQHAKLFFVVLEELAHARFDMFAELRAKHFNRRGDVVQATWGAARHLLTQPQ